GPIEGTADRNDAIAAKPGRVEIRVIGYVEHLRTELELALLAERKVLEDGEIQAMEARTRSLRNPTQVCKGAGINRASSRIRERTRRPRRIQSRVVAEPAGFSKAIVVTTDLQGPVGEQRATTNTLQGVVHAVEGDRLPALQRGNPLHGP